MTFRDFLTQVEPIRLREPLASALGAFAGEEESLSFSLVDVVKVAGHACPTVASAYICCGAALKALYGDMLPVRGEVAITVHGAPDEGVYGVIGQIFSVVTGAAPLSGFKGIANRYGRKDLLSFSDHKPDPEAMCFEFRRIDGGQTVLAKIRPQLFPGSAEQLQRISDLIQKVILDTAGDEERTEFQRHWMARVQDIALDQENRGWLSIEQITPAHRG